MVVPADEDENLIIGHCRRLVALVFVFNRRIPVLILGVYSLGYQQGIIDTTAQPMALQQKVLAGILAGQGVTDMVGRTRVILKLTTFF